MDAQTISLLLGAFVGILLSLIGAGGHAGGRSWRRGRARMGIVRYKAAGLMAGCGVVFAPLGIWLAQRLPNAWLTVLFAGVLVFVALRILQQANRELDALGWADDRPSPPCQLDKMRGKLRWTAPCARSIMLAGSMAGFLSGLLGVGGGFVIVPALRGFTNLDIKSIVATSLAVIAIVSAGGVIVAAWHGLIIWGHAWPFATGAVVGMLAGRVLARGLTGPRVQQSFAVFALFVAVGLLINLVYKEEQSHGSQICPAWRAISGSNQLPLWASLCLLVDSDCQSTIAVRTLYQWVLTATD